ncbi:MAG: hypothetical protein HYZ13_16425 [Acidobacteria bacterium]|nr:hypothetical protein [Acidobacteriota bacterium]
MGVAPAADLENVIARRDALMEGLQSSGSRWGLFPAPCREVIETLA